MPKTPQVSGAQTVKALEKVEFKVDRIKGSHHVMKKEGHRNVVTVPMHRELKKGTLNAIISAAGLTLDKFLELLK